MNEKSPYNEIITSDVAVNGISVLSEKYVDIIKKTEIVYRIKIENATISYYDPMGLVVYSTKGNPDNFPIVGVKKITDKRKDYQKDYDKKNTVPYSLKLTRKDQDLIDFLNSLPNKQDFMRQAIREKMEREYEK